MVYNLTGQQPGYIIISRKQQPIASLHIFHTPKQPFSVKNPIKLAITILGKLFLIFFILYLTMASRQKKELKAKVKAGNASKEQLKAVQALQKRESPRLETADTGLFGSFRLHPGHTKRQSHLKQTDGISSSHKVITTDESNHCAESKVHESIFYSLYKEPNQEYFQSHNARPKKAKAADSLHSSRRSSKSKQLSLKFKEMKRLVVNQDREMSKMKGKVSEKELHRLVKMHSIERLKIISSVNKKSLPKSKAKR